MSLEGVLGFYAWGVGSTVSGHGGWLMVTGGPTPWADKYTRVKTLSSEERTKCKTITIPLK